jgi:hypothetical protein
MDFEAFTCESFHLCRWLTPRAPAVIQRCSTSSTEGTIPATPMAGAVAQNARVQNSVARFDKVKKDHKRIASTGDRVSSGFASVNEDSKISFIAVTQT